MTLEVVCPRSDSWSVAELERGPGSLHITLTVPFLPYGATPNYSSKPMGWLRVGDTCKLELGLI